jgi:hypothetical protein
MAMLTPCHQTTKNPPVDKLHRGSSFLGVLDVFFIVPGPIRSGSEVSVSRLDVLATFSDALSSFLGNGHWFVLLEMLEKRSFTGMAKNRIA